MPGRVPAGQEARGHRCALDNVSRLPTGLLLLVEDRVPYVLGRRPRFVLDRVEPRGRREVTYPVRSDVRGRYPLGPLPLRLTDPFGMCELTRSFTARDTLIVTPRVRAAARRCRWAASGRAAARAGRGRWPRPARTTWRPASTATATTCAGCTGAPPRG